jgi:hypothetical protein
MGPRKRKEPRLEFLLEGVDRVRVACRLLRQRLNGGKGVLDPMIELVEEQPLAFIGIAQLGDVGVGAEPAQHVAIFVAHPRHSFPSACCQ